MPRLTRSVVAESLLVKQQLLILNRSRHRAPNLRPSDRILAGVCALFMRPARVLRSAIVLRPSTILAFHRTLRACKYRWLFAPRRRRTGPKGPSHALVDAIVAMKRRNPRWGCPRIAQQIGLAFDIQIDKDVVRRVLATHYRPEGGYRYLKFTAVDGIPEDGFTDEPGGPPAQPRVLALPFLWITAEVFFDSDSLYGSATSN